MTILFATIVFVAIAWVSKKAGKGTVAFFFGAAAFIAFIAWLATGPGFAFLDWGNNPDLPAPPEIDVPGVK